VTKRTQSLLKADWSIFVRPFHPIAFFTFFIFIFFSTFWYGVGEDPPEEFSLEGTGKQLMLTGT